MKHARDFSNNGHTIQIWPEHGYQHDGGSKGVLRGGPLKADYQFLQMHFHWGSSDEKGSEHTLNGKGFPMELHVVHTKLGVQDSLHTSNGLAVTGFFFQISVNSIRTQIHIYLFCLM